MSSMGIYYFSKGNRSCGALDIATKIFFAVFLAAQDPAWHAWDWSGRFCLVSRLWSPLVSLLEHGQTDGFAAFAPLVVHPGGPQWKADCRGSGYEVSKSLNPRREWSLTQFYSVDFSLTRIGVKMCIFNKRTFMVCVTFAWRCPWTSASNGTANLADGDLVSLQFWKPRTSWRPLKGFVLAEKARELLGGTKENHEGLIPNEGLNFYKKSIEKKLR